MRGIRKVKAGEKEATAHRSAALCFTVPFLQRITGGKALHVHNKSPPDVQNVQ